MNDEIFEQLVEEGLLAIPEHLRAKVANVAIVVEDEPSATVRRAQKLRRNETLFGLYEGIPLTGRAHYGVAGTLPDKITIFRRPIEEAADGDIEELRAIVRDTIWHEIAHHFGLSESTVRASEAARRRKNQSKKKG